MSTIAKQIHDEPAESVQITEYSKTAAALAELRKKYEGAVFPMGSTAGMKQAKEARAEIKGYRVDLEKLRKDIKAPALERCRLIDEEAKRITAALEALENPIDEQIKAEETRKEAERKAKEDAEKARVAAIHDRIAKIQNAPAAYIGKSSAEIQAAKERAEQYKIDTAIFQECAELARAAKIEAVGVLEKMVADAQASEAEQARIAAEREELARLRAEAEARRQEEERQAKEAREAEEARIKAERDAHEARMRAEREAEERRLAEERQTHEAKMRAEREAAERIEAERRQAREAEERRLAEERAEIERQRREAEQAEQAEARANAERERAEREAAARQAREAAEKAKAERLRESLAAIETAMVAGELSASDALMQAYRLGRADMAAEITN